jgi:hypothetical protein
MWLLTYFCFLMKNPQSGVLAVFPTFTAGPKPSSKHKMYYSAFNKERLVENKDASRPPKNQGIRDIFVLSGLEF